MIQNLPLPLPYNLKWKILSIFFWKLKLFPTLTGSDCNQIKTSKFEFEGTPSKTTPPTSPCMGFKINATFWIQTCPQNFNLVDIISKCKCSFIGLMVKIFLKLAKIETRYGIIWKLLLNEGSNIITGFSIHFFSNVTETLAQGSAP